METQTLTPYDRFEMSIEKDQLEQQAQQEASKIKLPDPEQAYKALAARSEQWKGEDANAVYRQPMPPEVNKVTGHPMHQPVPTLDQILDSRPREGSANRNIPGMSNVESGRLNKIVYIDGQIRKAMQGVDQELRRAIIKHPGPLHSLHEAHSVIREEFDEFWDEVKIQKPDRKKVKAELEQLAAMAIRAIVELEL